MLSWKVQRALINAKLEPYLGFLNSVQFGKPSLVCDFQGLYRHLIDVFVIQFCRNTKVKDFFVKTEEMSRSKKSKREYLNDIKTKELTTQLNRFFESTVGIPRIKVGKRQSIETLINEEALLFAKCVRNEIKD